MLVRGLGVREVSEIERISVKKVLSVLVNSNHTLKPKQNHYDSLELDEFWTYVGNKKNKLWLIYAYHRATGEIVAFVWGERGMCGDEAAHIPLKSKPCHPLKEEG